MSDRGAQAGAAIAAAAGAPPHSARGAPSGGGGGGYTGPSSHVPVTHFGGGHAVAAPIDAGSLAEKDATSEGGGGGARQPACAARHAPPPPAPRPQSPSCARRSRSWSSRRRSSSSSSGSRTRASRRSRSACRAAGRACRPHDDGRAPSGWGAGARALARGVGRMGSPSTANCHTLDFSIFSTRLEPLSLNHTQLKPVGVPTNIKPFFPFGSSICVSRPGVVGQPSLGYL